MALVTTYEQKIDDLHSQKRILLEKTAQFDEKHKDFKRVFRTAFEFLANPWKLWLSEHLEDKRAVLKLTFMERIAYDQNEGFRTARKTLPFKALADISAHEMQMAVLTVQYEPVSNTQFPVKREFIGKFSEIG